MERCSNSRSGGWRQEDDLVSEHGSPIAEAENKWPSNLSAPLDGTIHGVRRLGNLSVPLRLSPGGRGGSILKWVPIPRRSRRNSPQRHLQRPAVRKSRARHPMIEPLWDWDDQVRFGETTYPVGRFIEDRIRGVGRRSAGSRWAVRRG
jgi:hypothetical protein